MDIVEHRDCRYHKAYHAFRCFTFPEEEHVYDLCELCNQVYQEEYNKTGNLYQLVKKPCEKLS